MPPGFSPRAVKTARTTTIPACTTFVDAAASGGDGSAGSPFKTIGAAVNAADAGAVICVAEGTYPEKLSPGAKYLTLAGGFQAGKDFKVRDSAAYVSKAQGNGSGSFFSVTDPAPSQDQLTVIDGFEITGYSQGINRVTYVSQKFDITNNYIHDNTCAAAGLAGGGFALNNVSGTIRGNVIAKNSCTRGGAGALDDTTATNSVSFENNLIDSNSGTEPMISHGGGLYLFSKTLTIVANEFKGNSATGWGGGLFVGANGAQQPTTASMAWNVYHDNKAGIAGGGFFCDDSAKCLSDHEVYYKNCGGNVYFDCGPGGTPPTIGRFDHLTSVNALAVGCGGPGAGVIITKDNTAADNYTFTNSIFWGNAPNGDIDASCNSGCGAVKVSVTYSSVQTSYVNGGVAVAFGDGNMAPSDPLFVDPDKGDFHLQSTNGHWTPDGYINDTAASPALAKGDPAAPVKDNPPRAGNRTELGAYGNTGEASYVQ